MELKAGDRVHVTRLDGKKEDFYATLVDAYGGILKLVDCTDSLFEGAGVFLPNDEGFGLDKEDYYTLITDEEDTEESEVQYIRESIEKLEQERKQFKQQRDELIEDIQAQRNLLKEFSKFIDYKLYIHPGNCTYLSYRNELDQLGICKEND